MRVLQYLIEGKAFDYTLTDMLHAGVSWGTLNVLIPKFLKMRIVVQTRKIGRATLYQINQENVMVKQFIQLYNQLISESLQQMQEGMEIPARSRK